MFDEPEETPDERTLAVQVAEYVGKRLAARPAKWAGDATMQPKQRTFGLIYPEGWDRGFVDQELAKYGTSLTDAMGYTAGDVTGSQERARTMIWCDPGGSFSVHCACAFSPILTGSLNLTSGPGRPLSSSCSSVTGWFSTAATRLSRPANRAAAAGRNPAVSRAARCRRI